MVTNESLSCWLLNNCSREEGKPRRKRDAYRAFAPLREKILHAKTQRRKGKNLDWQFKTPIRAAQLK